MKQIAIFFLWKGHAAPTQYSAGGQIALQGNTLPALGELIKLPERSSAHTKRKKESTGTGLIVNLNRLT